MTRGLENDWLQGIFREAFTPGVGGFVAMYAVHSWLARANLKFVFSAFSVSVFLFMIGLPAYFIIFPVQGWTFSWNEQILRWIGGVAALVGAWIAYQRIQKK